MRILRLMCSVTRMNINIQNMFRCHEHNQENERERIVKRSPNILRAKIMTSQRKKPHEIRVEGNLGIDKPKKK